MKKLCTHFALASLGCLLLAQTPAIGQEDVSEKVESHKNHFMPKGKRPVQKLYLSSGIDGYVLSTASLTKHDVSKMTIPRFTAFFHVGVNANYDFNKNFGLFTGVNIKNIGFIEKTGDVTTKRRVYTAGIPLALKLGNVRHGHYFMLGGGVDFPFNFKEKTYVKRSDKEKFNEWFSDRTPAVMPYVFVGAHVHPGLAVKLQYYPTNFLNADYSEAIEGGFYKPYADYDVKLMMLTLSFDISYYPKD